MKGFEGKVFREIFESFKTYIFVIDGINQVTDIKNLQFDI